MNINWTEAFLFPLIMLLTEYLVLQPILQHKGQKTLTLTNAKTTKYNWSDGIKNAVANFKTLNNSFHWRGLSLKQDFVRLSQFSIAKGQADITLSIFERYRFTLYQREIAKFRLIADRVGDISSSEELPMRRSSGNRLGLLISIVIWAIIASVIALGSIINSLPSPKTLTVPKTPVVVERTIQGITISRLWDYGIPLELNVSLNGTLEEDNAKSYIFTSTNNEQITILLNPISDFRCTLHIYNANGGLVTSESIYSNSKIDFAPEANSEYLIVVEPSYKGGSYTINTALQSSIISPEGRLSLDDAPSFDVLWSTATPILLDTPTNGVLGEKQFKAYTYTSTENKKRIINIETMENFHSKFYIYDQNGVLIQEESFYSNPKLEFAPEANRQYLFFIEASFKGGSYIISINSPNFFWFFD